MEKVNVMSFSDYCKDFIVSEIERHIGRDVYGCELGSKLTQAINADCSATSSADIARDHVIQWAQDGDVNVFDSHYKDMIGETFATNPLVEPKKYMVVMVIMAVDMIIGDLDCMQDIWNEDVVITRELADSIIAEVEAFSGDIF